MILESNSGLQTEPPKIQALCLRALFKHSLNSGSLQQWPLPFGAHCSAQPLSGEEPFLDIQPGPLLTQLYVILSG